MISTPLRRYAIAVLVLVLATAIRVLLIPVLGYRYGFSLFLVGTFVTGRYLGPGPSLLVLVAGAIPPFVLHFIPPDQTFDASFQIATLVYFFLGSIVVYVCRSEHLVRSELEREVAERKSQQEFLRHMIEVLDEERQLISYEIHDGLVQYATGAKMQLEALREQCKDQPIAAQLEQIVGILQKTVAEGRRVINGIRTPVLDDHGVPAAVEQLIDAEDRAHVEVEFNTQQDLGRMTPRIEETLYRITQEALTNVYKHSGSKKVRIDLGRRADRVHLEIQDWGIGFGPVHNSRTGHGLSGMSNRARIAGGQCEIHSAPGKGTQVVVDLPYVDAIEAPAH